MAWCAEGSAQRKDDLIDSLLGVGDPHGLGGRKETYVEISLADVDAGRGNEAEHADFPVLYAGARRRGPCLCSEKTNTRLGPGRLTVVTTCQKSARPGNHRVWAWKGGSASSRAFKKSRLSIMMNRGMVCCVGLNNARARTSPLLMTRNTRRSADFVSLRKVTLLLEAWPCPSNFGLAGSLRSNLRDGAGGQNPSQAHRSPE